MIRNSPFPCIVCEIPLHSPILIINKMNSSLHHLQEILLGTRSGDPEGKMGNKQLIPNNAMEGGATGQAHPQQYYTSNCVSVPPHNRQFPDKKPASNQVLSRHSICIPGNLYLSLTPWQLRSVQDLSPSTIAALPSVTEAFGLDLLTSSASSSSIFY
jgi:hypothetical protein